MDFTRAFQPRQIVYLEAQNQRLYAEVIQVVDSRQMCWVRPLFLVTLHDPADHLIVVDLRSQADLLWSTTAFRPALDTEVIPLFAAQAAEPRSDNPATTKQLHQFIRQVWQTDHRSTDSRD